MAKNKVIVKRLASIENFGSMNIICSDKTGTLTEGTVLVESANDVNEMQVKKSIYMLFSMLFMKPVLQTLLMKPS